MKKIFTYLGIALLFFMFIGIFAPKDETPPEELSPQELFNQSEELKSIQARNFVTSTLEERLAPKYKKFGGFEIDRIKSSNIVRANDTDTVSYAISGQYSFKNAFGTTTYQDFRAVVAFDKVYNPTKIELIKIE